ncbi:MAG: discoidin domain-containing protein [Magnetospirillum sp.]|nr:discoidin domain-containing protein [Magnetospirillum sp.]
MPEHIQVGNTLPRVQYVADGVLSAFSYSFPIFTADDIEVYVGTSRQTSNYSVSGAGVSSGGTVLFAVPPAMGALVTLRRSLAIQRTTDLQADGIIRAKTLNDELDYQTAALQQVAEDSGRAVKRAITSDSLADLTLPEPAALKAIKWNAAGTGLENTASDVDQAVAVATTQAAAAAASATAAAASAGSATAAAAAALALALPDAVGRGACYLRQNAAEDGLEYRTTAEVGADLGLGSAALLAIDTDDTMAADSDSRIPSQKAVKAFVTANAGSTRLDLLDGNIGLLFLSVARLTTSTAPEQGGQEVADEFDDQTGIGALGGATWASGYVSNPAISGLSSDLITGSEAYSASASSFSTTPGGAADENSSTLWAADYASSHWWSVQFGSGKKVSKVTIRNRTGYASGATLSSTDLQYYDGSTWQTQATRSGPWVNSVDTDWTFTAPPFAYTQWRLVFTFSSSGQCGIETIRMYEPVSTPAPNIATVSTATTAASAPSTVTLVAIWKDIAGTSTVNTDVVFKVSRDGGTTWTAVAMADFGPGPVSGSRVLKGSADLSGQPSGTSLKWKVETANAKEQQLHGIWMQWR